uniref:NADH-ubiquinone oxidoreductase chain 5 n=1 Tax=Rhinotergum shaoguanense TaxID=1452699 RepID=A0A1S5XVX0_9ACAR|nr:NADH dehydrogenase subunit 5 [Rhinotergum shaoguanense]AQQ72852.1 NADH dehydrogenase subunit 5 [Rhinotergum shaoguanense]
MLFFIYFLIWFLNFDSYYSLMIKIFDLNLDFMNNFNLGFLLDSKSLTFIFMVCFVTCLVSIYSEVYLEHYNNKKFFSLMFLFFMFMFLLSSSGSMINLFVGWDGLGLSSICLIMFYPNKTTLYNSILTMVFNRLGDVVLICVICLIFLNYSNFFFFYENFNSLFLLMLMVCSFTKSAQFPLSSWLPAAMSAPTPISAMVHSSTLVTAGVLLNLFFMDYYTVCNLSLFLSLVSLTTFILGGLMGSLELDLKKIIAFSTMSQISMILLFCSLKFINVAVAHMLFHAFFKTFLFMGAGVSFMMFFSIQMKSLLKGSSHTPFYLSSLIFLSIFSMSGLMFSSSFFSKDLILEILSTSEEFFFFMFLTLGSILTIIYSMKLLSSNFNFVNSAKIHADKNFKFNFTLIFCIVMVLSGKIFMSFFVEMFPKVSFIELILLNMIFVLSFFLSFSLVYSSYFKKLFLYLVSNISLMKYFTFTIFSNLGTSFYFLNFFQHDNMMFKSIYLNFKEELFLIKNFKSNFYALAFMILMFILYI